MPVVDPRYQEDCTAEVDTLNVVMTGSGRLIEVQATAETEPFEQGVFEGLLDLAEQGISRISRMQMDVITRVYSEARRSVSQP